MTLVEPNELLPEPAFTVAARAANEGIPVLAIARILHVPSDIVYTTLAQHRAVGTISEVPKADWPPTAKQGDRLPVIPRTNSDEDVMFTLRKIFRLTQLETAFLLMLVKYEHVDKATMHNVVEQQRYARAVRPEDTDPTDPKMVDVMICKLRKKLKTVDTRVVITTIWGEGYYFEPEVKQVIASILANGAPHVPSGKEDQGAGGPQGQAPVAGGAATHATAQ